MPEFTAIRVLQFVVQNPLKHTFWKSDATPPIPALEGPEPYRCVFLDRDGTLIDDVGYLARTDRISVREGVFDGIRTLLQYSYIPVVVTNQSGVARGLIEEGQLRTIHRTLHNAFLEREAPVLGWYYCPHLPPDQLRPDEEDGANRSYLKTCSCRKPGKQLWREAASDLPGEVDYSASWSVGDRERDVIPGSELGTGAVRVGQAEPAEYANREVYAARSFRDAVDHMIPSE